MAVPATVAAAIDQNARNPKRVRIGQTEVEQHDIEQQILADKHVKAQAASTKNHFGLRFIRLEPPGAG